MSNDLILPGFGKTPNKLANTAQVGQSELASGITTSYGIIGYKGKVWSIRYRGEEMNLMREDGDGPRNSIEAVILKGATHLSKIWYEQGYVEGSTAAPDCYSFNGVTPDAAATKPQSPVCATCPKNAWGSRITPAGKKGKACADSKRIVIVPLDDMNNEAYGGPMLLRIPAGSLQALADFDVKMSQVGYPSYAYGTRIEFDTSEAYPKFLFKAIRELSDEECDISVSLRDSLLTTRILAQEIQPAPADAVVSSGEVFEQPPAQKVQPATVVNPAPAKAATPVTAKVATPVNVTPKVNTPSPSPMVVEFPKPQPTQKATGFGKAAPAVAAHPTQQTALAAPAAGPVQVVGVQEAEIEEEEGEPSAAELTLDEELEKLL